MSSLPPSLVPETERLPEADPHVFRAAMRELAGGVAVVTVGSGRDITGFTATSLASLSAHPPRLLVCVALNSMSWPVLQVSPYFAVNLLRSSEHEIANRFAGRDGLEGAARFAGTEWTTLVTGSPVLEKALAALDCEAEEMLSRYDHAIVVGRVCAIQTDPGSLPLVYWDGDYHPFERARGV